MEDAATSEISRAQLWQWLHHGCKVDGKIFTKEWYKKLHEEEIEKLGGVGKGRLGDASKLLDKLVLSDVMDEFLTIPAYEMLINAAAKL